MVVLVALYLLIGLALGLAWNRAEIGRASPASVGSAVIPFLLLWPVLAGFHILVVAYWSWVWRQSHVAAARGAAGPPPLRPGAVPRPR